MRFVRIVVAVMTATTLFCAPVYAAEEPITREVVGVVAPDDSLFPESIETSGTVYPLEDIEWIERIVTRRSAHHEVEYDFGAQVGRVDPPDTLEAAYYDSVTGVQVAASLGLVRLVSAGTSTRGSEDEVFIHTSYDTAAYEVSPGVSARFDAPTPLIAGETVSNALLEALHYDPATYRLVSAVWNGPVRAEGAKTAREASYTVERKAEAQRAVYGGDVALPDTVVYDGVATYRAPTVVESVVQAADRTVAAVTETVEDDPLSLVPWIAAAAVAGTSILGAVIFWRRKRRRPGDEDEAGIEPDDTAMEADYA